MNNSTKNIFLLVVFPYVLFSMEAPEGRVKRCYDYAETLLSKVKIDTFLLAICDDNNPNALYNERTPIFMNAQNHGFRQTRYSLCQKKF